MLLINDLHTRLNICSIMCVDDTFLLLPCRDVYGIEQALNFNSDLEVVENCHNDNGLLLNKTKAECVLFGKATRVSCVTKITIYTLGDLIKRLSRYEYLGVVLDNALSWNTHVKYFIWARLASNWVC